MTGQTSTEYEKYYVPEKSRLALCATTGLILSIYGASGIMNDMTFGDPVGHQFVVYFLIRDVFLCRYAF